EQRLWSIVDKREPCFLGPSGAGGGRNTQSQIIEVSIRALRRFGLAWNYVRVARGRIEEPGTPVRLIIGVDGSKGAEAAVEAVAARKWPPGSEARIVNATWAMPPITSHRMINPITEWIIEEKARVKCHSKLLEPLRVG